MKIELIPILAKLRAIYDQPGAMDRYNQYVKLMTEDYGELLPLGDFSPMGLKQKQYLSELIDLGAEDFGEEICATTSTELTLANNYRLMLVVLDEPRNGWTQRYLTEASWRINALPSLGATGRGLPDDRRQWVPVQLWTTNDSLEYSPPSFEYLKQQIRAAIFRAQWKAANGVPLTLLELLNQEGAAMKFSGEEVAISKINLENIKQTLISLYPATAFPILFSAMYGDDASQTVGYTPVGVPSRGGFAFARSLTK